LIVEEHPEVQAGGGRKVRQRKNDSFERGGRTPDIIREIGGRSRKQIKGGEALGDEFHAGGEKSEAHTVARDGWEGESETRKLCGG